MKGGITSGVVYPLAMCELATAYRFRNIGGTSTGAIAAAYTAAAEYARGTRGAGFEALADLPGWFGRQAPDGHSNLFSLFRPDPATTPLFRVFAATLHGRRNPLLRVWNIVRAAARAFTVAALAGAVPGLVLAVTALAGGGSAPVLQTAALVLSVPLALAGAALAVGWSLYRAMMRDLPDNNYGLCSGYAPPDEGQGAALTNWIVDTVDRLAGRDPERDPPLTFGDLWERDLGGEQGINLRMMTTNLTQGRPMSLPFEDAGEKGIGQYYFDPAEFRRLFPPRIVDWLVAHARRTPVTEAYLPLVALPRARDLPVAVAARLSLSYPLLLSAIPLHTIDWARALPQDRLKPERCWFSDGGITSNFPMHFFDQPLPRWPTFAINLRPPHPDLPDVEVWMPRSNRERGVAIWHRFDREGSRRTLFGFLSAIRDTTQNWADNEQARVPGYRDRVVHITLKPREGGINLDMPGPVVEDIADRGRRAGRLLVERFVSGPKWDVDLTWENHRWVRFRSTMHVVEDMLRHMQAGYRYRSAGERSYAELIGRAQGDPPTSYPWYSNGQRRHAVETTEALIALVEGWTRPDQTFDRVAPDDRGPPEPYPTLRIMPRV